MKAITIKLYQFSELTEQAKKKAIKWFLNSFDDSFAWQDIVEDAKQIGLKLITLSDNKTNKGQFITSATDTAELILSNHGKHCGTYKTAKTFLNELEELTSSAENIEDVNSSEIEEIEESFLALILEDYRLMYNNQIEYEYSDEYAIDGIQANEYYFTKNGEYYNN